MTRMFVQEISLVQYHSQCLNAHAEDRLNKSLFYIICSKA